MKYITPKIFIILTINIILIPYSFSQENEKLKNDSIVAESTNSALFLESYSQKKEWADSHGLMIDYTSIISVNVFKDEKNPKISITTKELMIDSSLNENRIYWISFKSNNDLDGLVKLLWKYKSKQPSIPISDPKF